MTSQIPARLGTPHGLQTLRGDRGRRANDVQPGIAPMGWHLASAARGVCSRPHRLQQLLLNSVAQGQTEGTVPIVWIEPIVAGLQSHSCGYQQGFVASSRNLEKYL